MKRLLAALAVSQLGDWLYNLALLAFVFDRTHSVGWTAATTAARVVPMVVLGPLGGVLADRHDRRRLMIVSDAVRVALMAALAGVAATGAPIVLAPVLAALATAAGAVYPPAVAASLPRLVGSARLARANAARSAIQSAAIIVGPAGGGLLLLLGSPAAAFALNGLTFAVSAALLVGLAPAAAFAPPAATVARHAIAALRARSARLRGAPAWTARTRAARRPGSGPLAELGKELRDGALALRAHPMVARLLGADILCSLVYGAQTVLLLLLAHRLGFGDGAYGYLLAGAGVGALAGAWLAPRLRGAQQAVGATLAASGLATAVMAATLPLAGPVGLAVCVLLAAVTGAASATAEIVSDTAVARAVDESVLARAYGLVFPASIAGLVLGSLIAAPLVAVLGLAGALIALGAVTAAYLIVLAWPALVERGGALMMIQVDPDLVARG